MTDMIISEENQELVKKWKPVLENQDVAPIVDDHIAAGTALLLENTHNFLISEATPNSVASNISGLEPAMLGMVRRMGPTILKNPIVGVQPMSGPVAQVFCIRPVYNDAAGTEIHANPRRTAFTGQGSDGSVGSANAVASDTERDPFAAAFTAGSAMATALGEGDIIAESSITVDSVPVTAKTRSHKSTFSHELAQDLKAQHKVDARALISSVLGETLVAETNLEILRKVIISAVLGCTDTATPGTYDLNADPDGRWLGEKGRTLAMRIMKEASEIFDATRLGHGNFAIVDPNTYNLLWGTGLISDAGPSNNLLKGSGPITKTNETGVGMLFNEVAIYRDDANRPADGMGYCIVGWKGASSWESGMYHTPYVPAWLSEAIDSDSHQPTMAWKSRYGVVANPLTDTNGKITPNSNPFFRKFSISNLII